MVFSHQTCNIIEQTDQIEQNWNHIILLRTKCLIYTQFRHHSNICYRLNLAGSQVVVAFVIPQQFLQIL